MLNGQLDLILDFLETEFLTQQGEYFYAVEVFPDGYWQVCERYNIIASGDWTHDWEWSI